MLEYFFAIATVTLVYMLLVQSYNLCFGLAGLFNLGHIVFYGVGAYTAAILNTRYGIGFVPNLFFGACTAGLIASGFGLLTLRLSGHYLAIATLGAAIIAQVVAANWVSLTNGPLGIRGILEPSFFGWEILSGWQYFVSYGVLVTICFWALYRLFRSPYGRLLRAIQDDEVAVEALGKNTFHAKLSALVLSAAFAGIAGVLYTHYRLFLDTTIFALPEIIFLILALVVGGRGSFWGALLGTVFMMVLGEIPRFVGFPDSMIGALRNLLYAGILILVMLYQPRGLFHCFLKKRRS